MLYQAFDFTKFIVNGNILLPTVQITKSIVDQENVQSMRAVSASYTLKQTSKVVLTPPTWRDYLVRLYPKPAEVSEVLTPRNSIEKEAFDHEFKKGWSVGVRQAERIFDADYTRLENDIVGHYDFRILASQGVLSLPSTSQSLYPTYLTEDGKTLYINDKILGIDTDAKFTDANHWTPYFRQGGK